MVLTISGDVPQVTCGLIVAASSVTARSNWRAGIAHQSAPGGDCAVPQIALWRERRGRAGTRWCASSTATMPARAPASMAMLHTVMRPSMLSERMALPRELDGVAGSPGGADLADHGQHDVLGGDAARELALHLAPAWSWPSSSPGTAWRARARPRRCRCRRPGRRTRHACWCASRRTRRSSPAAWRPAPARSRGRCPGGRRETGNRPWRRARACSRPASPPACARSGPGCPGPSSRVGVLWSAVATMESMRQGRRPASFRPSKACGLVTSCTRCRSM